MVADRQTTVWMIFRQQNRDPRIWRRGRPEISRLDHICVFGSGMGWQGELIIPRQTNCKSTAGADFTFHRQAAPMKVGQFMYQGQAKAGPFISAVESGI